MSHDLWFAVPFYAKDATFCGMKIKIHRNMEGYFFPSKISATDKVKANSLLIAHLKSLFPEASYFQSPIASEIKDVFLSNLHDATCFFADPKEKISISCFEQDHLNLCLHTYCLEFKKIYDEIKSYSSKLETVFSFAKDPHVGYLTALPENSGSGISFEAYLFCPHLKGDVEIHPLFSFESFNNLSKFYILKTKNSASFDLADLISLVLEQIKKIKNLSEEITSNIFKTNKDLILDEVSKSLAFLKGSYRLNYLDTFENLLTLKMGFHLGLLSGIKEDLFLNLLLQAQRHFLSVYFKTENSSDDWLHERATWMQESLKNVVLNVLA